MAEMSASSTQAAAAHSAAGHPPGLRHHFEDMEQQHEAGNLGMWVFLVTEILFFGGLFAAYAIYRSLYLPGFEAGSRLLDVKLGATNTAVLIGSSLTMAMAVHAAQTGKRKALIVVFAADHGAGRRFSRHQGDEYAHEVAPRPGARVEMGAGRRNSREMRRWVPWRCFFCFYFFMTGLHALHMIIGFGIMTVMHLASVAREIFGGVLRAGGSERALLAFRGYCVDFSLPAALFDRRALLMSGHVVSVRLYVTIFLALLLFNGADDGRGVHRSGCVQHGCRVWRLR